MHLTAKFSLQKKWILWAILAFALSLRLYLFIGASFEDDLGFASNAFAMSRGSWINTNDQALRRMTYAPTALAYTLFGVNTATTHAYSILCAMLSLLIVFVLTRRFHGSLAAAIATLLLAITPLHVFYSTRLMPSIPEAMWSGLAIWLMCATEGNSELTRGQASRRYLGVGLLIGMAYLCRETGVILFAAPLMYLVSAAVMGQTPDVLKKRTGQFLWLVAGLGAILFAESAVDYVRTQDVFNRLHIVARAQSGSAPPTMPWSFFFSSLLNGLRFDYLVLAPKMAIGHALSISPHLMAPWIGLTGILIFLGVPVYTVRHLKGPERILWIWFWVIFLSLSFGSTSLTEYHPIRKFNRYQLLFLMPACAMVGALLANAFRRRVWRWPAALLCGAVILVNGVALKIGYRSFHAYEPGGRALHALIYQKADPQIPVYLDDYLLSAFHLWDKFEPVFRYLSIQRTGTPPKTGAYMVVTREGSSGKYVSWMKKPYLTDIPPRWVKIADLHLKPWDYFQYGLEPVLFFIPPDEDFVRAQKKSQALSGLALLKQ